MNRRLQVLTRAVLATAVVGMTLAVGLGAGPAAAETRNQVDVGADVNCNLNGLHQGTGPVSTCGDLTIVTEVLVNGASEAAGHALEIGDVVTVRLTVTPRGGHDAFYEETVDGIRNNGGGSDMRFALDIALPGETGTELSAPTNVQMSRTDNGDRGNGPLINCLAHNGQEGQRSDPLTAVTLGGPSVGTTAMNASLAGGSITARWDDMAWDRCVNVLSNNGFYGGHVIQFDQTVDTLGTSTLTPTWNFGQVRMERTDGSRVIRWGTSADQSLTLPAAPYIPGPAVVDDGAQVDATYPGQSATSAAIDVLANDSGADPIQITAVGATTSGGTVDCGALPGVGPCTYQPSEGFSGTDTFTYTVTDSNGSSTAQVTVNVIPNSAPDADDDLGATTVGVEATGNVLGNDTDADGDDLAVTTTPVAAPANGTVTLAASGDYTYTPDPGFFGADTFTYEVCDTHQMLSGAPTSRCATATVTISVDAGDGPSAVGDLAATDTDVPVDIDVIANDDVGDTGPVTITATTTPVAGGTVTCTTTSCTYTPPSGFSGTDGFTYTITDAVGRSASASVTVGVVGNHAPIAVDDAISAIEDGPAVSGDLSGNDTEIDGEALTYTATPVVAPTKGTVAIAADGTFTYTPAAGESGTDTFTYEVCDDHQTLGGDPAPACSEATVTVTITATPLVAPIAVEDGANTDVDIAVDIDVLANDEDPDGDPSTLTIASAGYGGTPGVSQAGGTVECADTCTYTPPLGFSGTDAFTYTVTDADDQQASALVLVTVVGNLPPVAADDFGVVARDDELSGSLVDNDQELDGDSLIYTTEPVVAPAHGSVAIAADGTYVYTPDAGYAGIDQFVYEVCDDHTLLDGTPAEECSQAQATVLVGYATMNDLDDAVAMLDARIDDHTHSDSSGDGPVGTGLGGALARTGAELRTLVVLGFVALAAGALLLRARSTRRSPTDVAGP